MNITDNLIRIKEGKENIIKSLKNKGVSIADNTLINEIPTIIDNAEIGGGGDTPVQPETPELIQKYEGASVFRINVPEDNYEFAINLCNDATKATYDVDWGDGSLEYGLTTDEQHHTYTKKGIYDVNVYNISNNITLGGNTNLNNEYKDNYNSLLTGSQYPFLFNNTNNDIYTSIIEPINNCICTNILIDDKITKIQSYTFQNYISLQNITILSSVASIADYAFLGCSGLTSVTIPSSVTSIGSSTFQDCINLVLVEIPSSVKTISSNTFRGCSGLISVTIPSSVTSIGSNCFEGCRSLQNITIPDSVKTIGSNAFSSCMSLQNITIPSSVTSIGGSAFSNCRSLQNITIPSSVTSIGSYVFSGCSGLTSVTIPSSVTSIGSNCFTECYSLQSFTINSETAPTIQTNSFITTYLYYPQRILYVPKDSVGYDEGNWQTYLIDEGWELRYIEDKDNTTQESILKFKTKNNVKIEIPYICEGKLISENFVDGEYIYTYDKEITQLSGLLYCQEMLVDITIPNTVKNLGRATFCNSPYFYQATEIIVPEGVEYIGELCYYSKATPQFNKVVLPSTIKEIKGYNFYFQKQGTLTCKAMIAPIITNNSFSSNSIIGGKKITLRVPEGATGYEEGYWVRDYITLEYIPLDEL